MRPPPTTSRPPRRRRRGVRRLWRSDADEQISPPASRPLLDPGHAALCLPGLAAAGRRDVMRGQNALTLMGVWVSIGIGVGAALGVALDNLAVWTAIGAAIGIALGYALSRQTR